MSDLRITHTDSNLNTWLEFGGMTYGVTSWGMVLSANGIELNRLNQVRVQKELEAGGFTAAAKAFARNQKAYTCLHCSLRQSQGESCRICDSAIVEVAA